MNIFEQIRKDHKTQRTLIDLLVKTGGASDGRKALYERLKRNSRHMPMRRSAISTGR